MSSKTVQPETVQPETVQPETVQNVVDTTPRGVNADFIAALQARQVSTARGKRTGTINPRQTVDGVNMYTRRVLVTKTETAYDANGVLTGLTTDKQLHGVQLLRSLDRQAICASFSTDEIIKRTNIGRYETRAILLWANEALPYANSTWYDRVKSSNWKIATVSEIRKPRDIMDNGVKAFQMSSKVEIFGNDDKRYNVGSIGKVYRVDAENITPDLLHLWELYKAYAETFTHKVNKPVTVETVDAELETVDANEVDF